MKYCMECGTKLETKYLENEGVIPFCPNCNEFRFPIYSCAVSMEVLNPDKNKVVLIKQYGRDFNVLVAGYINWAYTQPVEEAPVSAPVSTDTEVSVPEDEVLKKAREARDSAREKSREMLQEAINNPATPDDGKVAAGNAINEIASSIEKEGICEGALIAKGMSDAVVFISDGKVSVSVKSVNELTSEEIVKIKDVIIGNTGITADNIKISSIE